MKSIAVGIINLLLYILACKSIDSLVFYAPINSGGIRGNVTFFQETPDKDVKIKVFLSSTFSSTPQQFDWALHEFPVFFDLKNPCQATELGKPIYDLSRHGFITISSNSGEIQFNDKNIRLKGQQSIWGRSLYLKSTNGTTRACSNIMTVDKTKTAIATFTKNIAGSIIFRENELTKETFIFSNLFYTIEDYRSGSKNDWKVMVTDILDSNVEHKCSHLQILLDPENTNDESCSTNQQRECKIGEMVKKHGQIVVGNNNNRYSKRFYMDTNFPLEYIGESRKIYVAIYEKNSNRIISCAEINFLPSKQVKTHFDFDGVKGEIAFMQSYKIDPTIITIKLNNLRGRGKHFAIHEYPLLQRQSKNFDRCSDFYIGKRYNPYNISSEHKSAEGTSDQYEVGDLSGKHGTLSEIQDMQTYFNSHLDFNLPLFGQHSVIGRSIVIYKENGTRWICANIAYPGNTVIAKATFYYPVTGEIIFRQLENDPFSETTVFGELFYSDGTIIATRNHLWRVHEKEIGRDFFNWTKRCWSSGEQYNPFGLATGRSYNLCSSENSLRCQVGDLYLKFKRIDINVYSSNLSAKFFYTDLLLPLSGESSIIARSVVIEDDNGSLIRGKRLACATIRRSHPVKLSVREWRTSSGIVSNVSGYIEFIQESEFDETKIKINIKGLNALASGFHIHKVSVPLDKEFPCSGDVVYGHFNPFEIDSSIGPLPSIGSVDEYETGDLSGKFGLLNNLKNVHREMSDFSLPVKGINSISGRSLVIHKEENNFRWSCGTIQPIIPEKGREIVAIAPFDDPRNLICGYVHFKQIEYSDGSLSETWIETFIKHRNNNKKITYGHKWSVFVNPVSTDAFNTVDSVRCIAGGFLWNPYLSKMDDVYKNECTPESPLRCALGDLTGRHGPLAVGGDRQVYSDVNLPLTGNHSIIDRALVISMRNNSNTALSCANIKINKHLISTVVIQKVPAFTVAKFMHHMRSKLGTTDWLVVAELQKSKEINEECVQMLIHFYGNEAWKLQSEFNNLIEYGSIKKPNGDMIKTYYKSCKKALIKSSCQPTFQLSIISICLLVLFDFSIL